ncbi:RNA polymerase sigma factor [Candidatus Sumerlaeota bacterium]
MDLSNDELIARYRQGNADAFDELYHRYAARMLGFVRSLGAGPEAAEDIAQRTWLKVVAALEAYRPQGRFRAWLFTLAYRSWADEARAGGKLKTVSLEQEDWDNLEAVGGGTGLRDELEAREQHALVEQALGGLAEEMRRTVLLRIDGDLKYREIAEEMECPLGTVLWRMNEAVRRLREQLASGCASGRPKRQNTGE